jgi:hypothetical protein
MIKSPDQIPLFVPIWQGGNTRAIPLLRFSSILPFKFMDIYVPAKPIKCAALFFPLTINLIRMANAIFANIYAIFCSPNLCQ